MLQCIPITIAIPIYDENTNDLVLSDQGHYTSNSIASKSNTRISKVITTTIVEATAVTQNQLVDRVLQSDTVNNTNDDSITINSNSNTARPLQDPYGAVLWPAAHAVTSYILSHYSRRRRRNISHNNTTIGNVGLDLLFDGEIGRAHV